MRRKAAFRKYQHFKCISAPIRAQVVRHINIHSEVKPYTCSECGKGFNFKQKVRILLALNSSLDLKFLVTLATTL